MLRMTAQVKDADLVIKRLGVLKDSIETRLLRFMKEEGFRMESEIKQSMKTGGRRGRIGPRGGKGVRHSAPGEPPYVQTGRLRASIAGEVSTVPSMGAVFLDVGAIRGGKEVKYAAELETGRSNMAPRPYLMPVVKKHLDRWENMLHVQIVAIK